MNVRVPRPNGPVPRVRLGCFPMLVTTILLSMAAGHAGETGLTIPATMLKDALRRLELAKITVLAVEAAGNEVQICVDTKDSKRAREVIVNGQIVERIRDAE